MPTAMVMWQWQWQCKWQWQQRVVIKEWTLRGYEAFILLPVLVHIHSLALHCYRWRGFEYKCSSWYPDLNGFWRPLVALAASSARAPARMPQGM